MALVGVPRPGHPPTKLTPDVLTRIVDFVRGGNYPEVAAAAVGIGHTTFIRWLKEGGKARTDYLEGRLLRLSKHQRMMVELVDEIHKALGESEARDVLLVGKHAEKDWRAAAFRLERKSRRRWGPQPDATDTGEPEQLKSKEQIVAFLERSAAKLAAGGSVAEAQASARLAHAALTALDADDGVIEDVELAPRPFTYGVVNRDGSAGRPLQLTGRDDKLPAE